MLLNLLSNAVKFTPEGGHIAIACAGMRRQGGLDVTVWDDGPGIPEDKLARVLEPFSQIDNRFDREAGGTGFGLALVDGLVAASWRQDLAQKQSGRRRGGYRFTFHQPCQAAQTHASAR